MIKVAKVSNANAIKFQTYKTEELISNTKKNISINLMENLSQNLCMIFLKDVNLLRTIGLK